MKKIVSVVVVLALSACSTFISGNHQDLKITTDSTTATGNCTLTDKKGRTYYTKVPGSVLVSRGDGPLQVTCEVDGGTGMKTVKETFDYWTVGNVLIGGLIGIFMDSYHGAYQKYPEIVKIDIVKLPSVTETPASTNAQ